MPLRRLHHLVRDLVCPELQLSQGVTLLAAYTARRSERLFLSQVATTAYKRYVYIMSKHTSNPQDFGWKPTGANEESKVAFYEKEGVKMDYYPTTGTVKTSMDHPSQGHTQMFRRDLNNDQFQSVLQNPRSHTGQGYQTKSSKYYKY